VVTDIRRRTGSAVVGACPDRATQPRPRSRQHQATFLPELRNRPGSTAFIVRYMMDGSYRNTQSVPV
jgi:hypothetical protein